MKTYAIGTPDPRNTSVVTWVQGQNFGPGAPYHRHFGVLLGEADLRPTEARDDGARLVLVRAAADGAEFWLRRHEVHGVYEVCKEDGPFGDLFDTTAPGRGLGADRLGEAEAGRLLTDDAEIRTAWIQAQ